MLIGINMTLVLGMMGLEAASLAAVVPRDVQSLIPNETLSLNLFVALQLTSTVYVGRCDLDRLQYLLIRLLPFLALFAELGHTTLMSVDYCQVSAILALLLLAHLLVLDWGRAVTGPFDEVLAPSEGEARKVIVENNEQRLKMIVYRARRDGGIQGILMDFYIDIETGTVANEFLRICERENGEVDLIKVEGTNILPVRDSEHVQKAFKQLFLKQD